MKTGIRTITLILSLALASASFAQDQKDSVEVFKQEAPEQPVASVKAVVRTRTEADRARAAEAKARAAQAAAAAKAQAVEAKTRAAAAAKAQAVRQRYLLEAQRHTGGLALIIPDSKGKEAEFFQTAEDMRIMSRILDKQVPMPTLTSGSSTMWFAFAGPQTTRSLYLQGYGAVFLMNVDFPLAPPPGKEENLTEEAGDLIWEKTKRELYNGPPRENLTAMRRSGSSRQPEAYDRDKVEHLKRRLLKALKHATNIRHLKEEEWVILAVLETGDAPRTDDILRAQLELRLRPEGITHLGHVEPHVSGTTGPGGRSVLTIRVQKGVIDAFAKGRADFNAFRTRVQVFLH